MRTNTSLSGGITSFLLSAALAASAQDPPAYTELISPDARSGGQFGASFGGLPDLTQDGVGEFYVFGNNRLYIYNGATVGLLYSLSSAGCAIGIPCHSAGDLNGDGIADLMLGKRCGQTLFGAVDFVDGPTGQPLFTLDPPNPVTQGFFGSTLRLLPDMTGDDKEDWLIHQSEFQSRAGRVYIFDSQTREVVRTIQNTEAAYRFWMRFVEVIPDVDADGKPELLVSANVAPVVRNGITMVDAGRTLVRSLQSGQVLYELHDPEPQAGGGFSLGLSGVGDITGDGVGDIAVGAPFKDGGTGVIYFFNGTDGQWLRTLRSPNSQPAGRFGWWIESVPDLNGDGVPELWTQEDGLSHAYLYDGATSTLLKTVEYPGPSGTIFRSGTVLQQAAPGIRAHLFAAQNALDSGRVYYMPFTPISIPPSPEVRALGFTDTGLRLQVTGRPGSTVEIQGSIDLTTWGLVAAPTIADAPVDVEDPAAVKLPRRFYRAVERE